MQRLTTRYVDTFVLSDDPRRLAIRITSTAAVRTQFSGLVSAQQTANDSGVPVCTCTFATLASFPDLWPSFQVKHRTSRTSNVEMSNIKRQAPRISLLPLDPPSPMAAHHTHRFSQQAKKPKAHTVVCVERMINGRWR